MPTSDSMWAPHNADKRDTWFGAKRAQSNTTTDRAKHSSPRDIASNMKPLDNQEDAPKTPTNIQPPATSGAYQSMWAPHNADKRARWLAQSRPSAEDEPSPTSVRKASLSVFVASEARLLQTALYEALDTSSQEGDIAVHGKPMNTGTALDELEDAPRSAKGFAIRGASAGERVVEDLEESGESRTPRRAKKIKRHTASESAPWGRWEHDHFESM
ncbi:uncharacterized protein SCHCODRAFT_02616833 [Schizophyllum commune H4-8]|nr:uncharacterized protein SCHCODRAFT_02616833 [Schizophyllum commune H4-8]KAI5897146.1 hypothetical protein SCHCODRAFT_02616833 [Schizophyllum commune H4-8]